MPTPEPTDAEEEPSPTFNGTLNQYIYKTSSNNTDERPSKRKRDETSDETETVISATTTATAVRTTRSKTSQQTFLSVQNSRTRSRNNSSDASTPATSSGNGGGSGSGTSTSASEPTPAAVATTGISRLRDTIPDDLVLLFIGVNPGIMTGQTGHVYAHPSNLYWRLLHSSGITTHRHPPSDTYRLPSLYYVGNTNIVTRATRDASQLSRAEMNEGVPVLEQKIAKNRPEAVCLVGKSIWEAVWRVRKGKNIKKEEFKYGWQDERENMGRVAPGSGGDGDGWNGARVFVATTTSGLAAGMSLAEKQAVWNELGDWVKKRRLERGIPEPPETVAMWRG